MEELPERIDEKPANDDARKSEARLSVGSFGFEFDYDADGRVCQITDFAVGHRTTFVFDHTDNLTKVIGADVAK